MLNLLLHIQKALPPHVIVGVLFNPDSEYHDANRITAKSRGYDVDQQIFQKCQPE
jgi:hypothetical protein